MVSPLLRSFTRKSHQNVEKRLLQQLRGIQCTDDYVGVLRIFYGYFYPLEHKLAEFKLVNILPDYSLRRKSTRLWEDIHDLNSQATANIPLSTNIPSLETDVQALGALYVMEGSTLGGKIISKMVTNTLGISRGLAFFSGYGEQNLCMWETFIATIDALSLDYTEQQEMLLAAKETFVGMDKWIEENA